MLSSNSRFVAPLVDGESSDGSVNRGGKRIQILTVCSVFCFLKREQFSLSNLSVFNHDNIQIAS